MYIDPITLNWILIGAASVCAGMIGYYFGRKSDEVVIANTITYLAQEGFVRSFHNSEGELELIKLNEKLPTEEE
jgi:Ni,Fe-hydrogenase I cytochrome b subunit